MNKYFVIFRDYNGEIHAHYPSIADSKEQAIKNALLTKDAEVVEVVEVKSLVNVAKCEVCGKYINAGDKVIGDKLREYTVTFVEGKERIESGSNIGEHQRRIHAYHVTDKQREEYKMGHDLWEKGMEICYKVDKEILGK